MDSDHAGFSGTGFVNGTNEVGSYVEFTVPDAQAGAATLTLRYANGTTVNRPMNLMVNGGAPTAVAFNGTGAWTTWADATAPVTLTAGLPAAPPRGDQRRGGQVQLSGGDVRQMLVDLGVGGDAARHQPRPDLLDRRPFQGRAGR